MYNIKKEIFFYKEKLIQDLKKVNNLEDLKQIKSIYLVKNPLLNNLKNSIKLSNNKAEIGLHIKSYLNIINNLLEVKKEELNNSFFMKEKENVYLSNKKININDFKFDLGVVHPLSILTIEVMNFFSELNYDYLQGTEIENEKYNFDILNIPKNHPARKMQDTFFLSDGNLLRTHATTNTARELEKTTKNNLKSFSIGYVFRNDTNDSTHSFQFSQIDIFNLGQEISISNLKWTLNKLMKKIFTKNINIRYRPSYFPFTEPSFEVDISNNDLKKTNVLSGEGWIEILGSGMLHNNVIKNAGKNCEELSGFAAGIGLERLAMIKWNISDIRDFYINDLKFLREYKN